MKTIPARTFFRSRAHANSLRPGQSLLLTHYGKPDLIVTKAGKRPFKTAEDMRREAEEMFPKERPIINLTETMRRLKE